MYIEKRHLKRHYKNKYIGIMNIIHEINDINRKFLIKGSKLKLEKRGGKLNILSLIHI